MFTKGSATQVIVHPSTSHFAQVLILTNGEYDEFFTLHSILFIPGRFRNTQSELLKLGNARKTSALLTSFRNIVQNVVYS